jgi:hypothetical protein
MIINTFFDFTLHGGVAVAVDHVLQHQVAGKNAEPDEFGAFVQFGQHVLVGRGVAHPVVRTDIRQFGQFHVRLRGRFLHISQIEKNVSLDHTRNCIQTYNKNKKIHVRINSTVKVIRACIFRMLSVLEVT